jgi:hypothetical protein
MSGRPEGADYDRYSTAPNEPYDRDAWQEFTPWRPGDKATDRPSDTASGKVAKGSSGPKTSRPSSTSATGWRAPNPLRSTMTSLVSDRVELPGFRGLPTVGGACWTTAACSLGPPD